MREVPQSTARSNDELSSSNDKSTDPKETKEVIDPYIASDIIPFHLCEHGVSGAPLGITHAIHEYSGDYPEDNPDTHDEEEDQRDKEY
jgi:hypothetical protein